MTKKCTYCGTNKKLEYFGKSINSKDGLNQACKECVLIKNKIYRQTKPGLITKIYSSQKSNSKRRNHSMPSYSKSEFTEWIMNQEDFNSLYSLWVENDFKKEWIPSVDRIDEFKSYSIDNIELMNWIRNEQKTNSLHIFGNGTHGLDCKKVYQYSIDRKTLINTFISTSDAGRKTKATQQNISKCCNGERKKAGGFFWSYLLL